MVDKEYVTITSILLYCPKCESMIETTELEFYCLKCGYEGKIEIPNARVKPVV
jgi:Zn finger protein HypA/HybF involved in hydrogenase expression